MSRHNSIPRRFTRAAAAVLILGAGLGPAFAQQDFGAGPTGPGAPQQQRPAPQQRQAPPQAAPQAAPRGGDFGGRDYRGGPPPQAAPAPGPRGGDGGLGGRPQPRGDGDFRGGPRGGRGDFDGRDRFDRRGDGPRGFGPPGYGYGPPRGGPNFGRLCVTARSECRVRPQPIGSRCGCDTPFGFRPGRVED